MKLTGTYTQAGEKLAAGLLAGEKLTVSRIAAGSGSTPLSAAALEQERQELGLCQPQAEGNSAVLRCTLSSQQASQPYQLTELGVYALDSTGKAVLYLIYRLDEPVSVDPAARLVLRFNLEQSLSDGSGVEVSAPLNGLVTQEQLDGKADLMHGQVPYGQAPHLTAYTTLYVDGNLGDDANPGTQQAPFRTVQAAVDSLPRDLGGTAAVLQITGNVADSDKLRINGFYGGAIQLAGEPGVTHCSVPVEAYYCTSLTFYGMTFDTPSSTDSMMLLADCAKVGVNSCTFAGADKSKDGVRCANQTNLGVSGCTFQQLRNAIATESTSATRGVATVSVYDCHGEGNSVAIYCTNGAICVESFQNLEQIGADTTVVKSYGGILFRQDGTLYAG